MGLDSTPQNIILAPLFLNVAMILKTKLFFIPVGWTQND